MTEPPAGDPPEPRTASAPSEFVARLRELRLWAGEPALRRLRQLAGTTVDAAGTTIDALPVSTASYVLRSDRLPRMEFVRAFVTACLRAGHCAQNEIVEQLERWHEAWLGLHRPPAARPPDAPPAAVPRQLPVDVADFTGRADELALLEKALAVAQGPGPVVISAIDGAGGIGKSTLAIHAAHRLADRFPDGQLYVDMHGATAGVAPLKPREVLGRFLRALGVGGSEIPDQVDEAAALFRTRLAGRRLLLVLDNAIDEAQVRPLLPGSQGCQVLVTSRQPLTGVAGANQLNLPVLPEPEAIDLLSRIIGAERVAAEPDAAAEVVSRCGRLPLALRIVGARLGARPGWSIAVLAQRLADEQRRLDELHGPHTGVRACFDISYQQLRGSTDPADRDSAHAFSLLGIWDGPDLSLPVAARLLDRAEPTAEPLLERLVDARLLETRAPRRYRFHDLLRLYAREQAERAHSGADRVAALERALRFYTASAWRTLALLRPGDRRHARADPHWRDGGAEFADTAEALAWLEAERPNLLAAAAQAAAVDQLAPAAVQLAQALFGFFHVRRSWRDLAEVNRLALQAARDLADPIAEAQAHNDLGGSYHFQGRFDEALACHHVSLAIRERLGDQEGQAASLDNLGNLHTARGCHDEAMTVLQRSLAIRRIIRDHRGEARTLNRISVLGKALGRYEEALTSLQRSLTIAKELGDSTLEASDLNSLGSVHFLLGRHREAEDCLRRSLELYRALGDRWGEAGALDTIGTIYHRQGLHDEALDCHQRSLATLRDLGSRHDEAEVLRNAGVVLQALSRTDEARAHWEEALAICDELGLPTGELRTLLAPDR